MTKQKSIIAVVGTRPNFIKITQFERVFQAYGNEFQFQIIHTGQHFDEKMSKVFFDKLNLKKPSFHLGIQESNREKRLEKMTTSLAELFESEKPDLVMVVGDVDSSLAGARAARKSRVKLAHVESGLRSFDLEMPEEVNRIEIDQIADYLFVTEQSGLDNLHKEGFKEDAIFFVGNTMIDTLVAYDEDIQRSTILKKLGLSDSEYILTTLHRPRNVDDPKNLSRIIEILDFLSEEKKIVLPVHPRTRQNFASAVKSASLQKNLIITEPLDYLDFQKLIYHTYFVLTDSGGIQEETTFRRVPCITLRPNTERPSTILSGSNELVEIDVEKVKTALVRLDSFESDDVEIPELWDGKSTERIAEILRALLNA